MKLVPPQLIEYDNLKTYFIDLLDHHYLSIDGLPYNWDKLKANPISPATIEKTINYLINLINKIQEQELTWTPPQDITPIPNGGVMIYWINLNTIYIQINILPNNDKVVTLIESPLGELNSIITTINDIPKSVIEIITYNENN